MTTEPALYVGFAHPLRSARRGRRPLIVELVLTAALVSALIVAATAVSIGMTRDCASPPTLQTQR